MHEQVFENILPKLSKQVESYHNVQYEFRYKLLHSYKILQLYKY